MITEFPCLVAFTKSSINLIYRILLKELPKKSISKQHILKDILHINIVSQKYPICTEKNSSKQQPREAKNIKNKIKQKKGNTTEHNFIFTMTFGT